MYPDMSFAEKTTSETVVLGFAAEKASYEGYGETMVVVGENGGCKCGANCTCDPCNCK